MNRKHPYRVILIMIFTTLTLLYIITGVLLVFNIASYSDQITWQFYINEEAVGEGSGRNPFGEIDHPIHKGDIVIMETVMPNFGPVDFPALSIRTHYSGVQIFIDDDYYKDYDMARFRTGKFIGIHNRIITLPPDYAGRKVQLRLYIQDDDVQLPMYNVAFDSVTNHRYIFLHMVFVPLVVGTILMLFGGVQAIISLTFSLTHRSFAYHTMAALMTTLMGALLHTNFGITSFYWDGIDETELYHLAAMLLILISAVWSARFMDKTFRMIHRWLLGAYTVYFALRIALHFTNIFWIHRYSYALMLWVLAFMLLVWLDRLKAGKQQKEWFDESWRLQAFGLSMAMAFLIVNYIMGGFILLISGPANGLYRIAKCVIMSGGLMIFPVCQLVNFLRFSTDSFRKNEQLDDLTRAAYEDVLTHLPNRAGLHRQVKNYENNNIDYCIISIDVNGLKATNDSYGHLEGDNLLKGFADALRSVVGRNGFCCRTGGDEFLVLLPESVSQAETDMLRFMGLLEDKNERESHLWKYKAAHGCAMRGEADSFHEAYLLADQRMYEKKRKMKETKG